MSASNQQPFLDTDPIPEPFAARINPYPGYRQIENVPTSLHGAMQILRVAVNLPDSLNLPPLSLRTPRSDIRNPEALAAFVQDWRTLSQVSHPNLIEVKHVHAGDGREVRPFVVTPWYAAGDMTSRVRRGLAPHALIGILDGIVQALIAMRDGVGLACVNHAISPDHILFDEAGLPVLAAYAGSMAYLVPAGAPPPFPRNVRYTSPEHVRGDPPGPASDIYSLGAVAFFGLTGEPPYQGAEIAIRQRHLYAPVPDLARFLTAHEPLADWQGFLDRTLAKRPAQRYPSLEAVREALAELREQARREGERRAPPRAVAGLADGIEATAAEDSLTAEDLMQTGDWTEPKKARWWPAVLALVLAAAVVVVVIASLMPPPGEY
jgi:serine/threonine-protein kinase